MGLLVARQSTLWSDDVILPGTDVGIDDEGRVSRLVAHAIAAKGRHRETSAGQVEGNAGLRQQTHMSFILLRIYIMDSQGQTKSAGLASAVAHARRTRLRGV